jgi:hypothetical protein
MALWPCHGKVAMTESSYVLEQNIDDWIGQRRSGHLLSSLVYVAEGIRLVTVFSIWQDSQLTKA